MSTAEKLFLGQLATLLRNRLEKLYNSPKSIAQLINRLIVVPKEWVSFQDIIQSAAEMSSEITAPLQEEGMYVLLEGVELDKNLQPVFSFHIEINDEDLKLNLVYQIKISKTLLKSKLINFEFDSALKKSYVFESLTSNILLYQIFATKKEY
jgi:hypothetical protein